MVTSRAATLRVVLAVALGAIAFATSLSTAAGSSAAAARHEPRGRVSRATSEFSGTWRGMYSLVVDTGGSCGTLPPVTGSVTFTLAQTGSEVYGKISVLDAYLYWNGNCQIYKRTNAAGIWSFVLSASGATALGEGFRLTVNAAGTELSGDYFNNNGGAYTFTAQRSAPATHSSESAPKHGCFDCVYIYNYYVHPQPQYSTLACTTRTTSVAGSSSPIIGRQTIRTTQAQRRWSISFNVGGIDCHDAAYAVIGVRVDNPNVPVQVVSATVNRHPVSAGNSAPGASVALPVGRRSFSLTVLIQANSGNYFAGDLNIIAELGPAQNAGSSNTWDYSSNDGADVFGIVLRPTPIRLTCDGSGHCTGSATSSDMTVSVVLQFSGTTATATETDTYPSNSFEDVTYQGSSTAKVEATGQPAPFPQADVAGGMFATATYSTGTQPGDFFWTASRA